MKKWKILGRLFAGAMLAFTAVPAAHAEAIDMSRPVSKIVTEQKEIQADAKLGKRGWDAVPAEKRAELASRQEELFELLSGKETLADLNESDQAKVVGTLEWVDVLATNADDERKICRRERKTGSNRIINVCRTAASIRKEREASQDALQRSQFSR